MIQKPYIEKYTSTFRVLEELGFIAFKSSSPQPFWSKLYIAAESYLLQCFLNECFYVFFNVCPSLSPPPSRFVSAPQILLTGFLEDGSAEQSFEIGERCCLAERSVATIPGWGNGTCDSSEAPAMNHVWGWPAGLHTAMCLSQGAVGDGGSRCGEANILHVKLTEGQRSVIRENTILILFFFLFASIG